MKNDYPKDVQDIIEYTRLRKQYPGKDRELREMFSFKGTSITKKQMYILLSLLRKYDNNGSKKTCQLCGKKFHIDLHDENVCNDCSTILKQKYGGQK